MAKMQNVSFGTVDDLLTFLPEDQLIITAKLRELVLATVEGVVEKLAYNVPFYRLYKNICFIWPGAVPWGNKTREGVEFGFNYGYLLYDASDYLDKGNRNQVYSKMFYHPEEIDEELLRHFLLESIEIDEMTYRDRKRGR